MSRIVCIAVQITRKDEIDLNKALPVDGYGIEIPVGSQVVAVGSDSTGAMCAFVVRPAEGVCVWHPLLLFPFGGAFNPMLGRKAGRCLGTVSTPSGNFAVLEDAPWPTSSLVGVEPAGAA